MFGIAPKVGLTSTNLPPEVNCNVYDEEDLERILTTLVSVIEQNISTTNTTVSQSIKQENSEESNTNHCLTREFSFDSVVVVAVEQNVNNDNAFVSGVCVNDNNDSIINLDDCQIQNIDECIEEVECFD